MAASRKDDGIEINEDLDFQRRSWKVQRIGWMVMLLAVVAGLAGLFGRGPLSSAELGAEGSAIRVEYERFVRRDAPSLLTVHFGRDAIGADSTVKVWIDREWLAGMEVTAITPEPEETETGATRLHYTFRVDPSSPPARIAYNLETRSIGPLTGRVGLVNGPTYSFAQFAYP